MRVATARNMFLAREAGPDTLLSLQYLGTWYEAERYFTVLEAGSRCVSTNYTKAVDGRVLVSNQITNRL